MFLSVQFRLLAVSDSLRPQALLSITNSWSPPKLMSVVLVMPSTHPILCRPLLLLPSIFPSIRVSSLHQVAKILEFQLQCLYSAYGYRYGIMH